MKLVLEQCQGVSRIMKGVKRRASETAEENLHTDFLPALRAASLARADK